MTAAATATTTPAKGTTSSFPIVTKVERPGAGHPNAEHPDLFFGRIHACLRANELPKALEILRLGNSSIHRNLVPGNIEKVAAFLAIVKETPEKTAKVRCSRLAKIMQKHFPDVLQIRMIKKKGIEAGLTAERVNQSLEQVVLKEGRVWLLKETHNSTYEAWAGSLTEMAGNNAINYWSEGCERASGFENEIVSIRTRNRCSSRGLFRGLENRQSHHWAAMFSFYEGFEERLIAAIKEPFSSFRQQNVEKFYISSVRALLQESCWSQNYMIYLAALQKTSKQSRIAQDFLDTLKNLLTLAKDKNQVFHGFYEAAKDSFNVNMSDISKWPEFLEAHLPNVFSDCTQEVQRTLMEYIAARRKYREIFGIKMSQKKSDVTSADLHDQAVEESGVEGARDNFMAVFTPVRDAIFANSFCSDWPNRKKDAVSLVNFGTSHAAGFKREVLALQGGSEESKEAKDEKKNENNGKLESKTSRLFSYMIKSIKSCLRYN